jgi:hypothetical protein
MKTALLLAAALSALSFLPQAFAQNQLPPTNVRAPKPALQGTAIPSAKFKKPDLANNLPVYADPSTPKVRSTDWNAPGVYNLHYMNDAQFAQFEKVHRTAVMEARCYIGQDPDPNIRGLMRGRWGVLKLGNC